MTEPPAIYKLDETSNVLYVHFPRVSMLDCRIETAYEGGCCREKPTAVILAFKPRWQAARKVRTERTEARIRKRATRMEDPES